MSRPAALPKRACVVTIGYMRLLMPADDGMRVIGLLQHAVEAGQHFGATERFYFPKGAPNIELEMVRPDQLKAVAPADLGAGPPAPRRTLALAGSTP